MAGSWTYSGDWQSVPQEVAAEQLDSALGSAAPWADAGSVLGLPRRDAGGALLLVAVGVVLLVVVGLRVVMRRVRGNLPAEAPPLSSETAAPRAEGPAPPTMKLPPEVAALLARLDQEGPVSGGGTAPQQGSSGKSTAGDGSDREETGDGRRGEGPRRRSTGPGGIEVWIGR